jgi:hypothetical protein
VSKGRYNIERNGNSNQLNTWTFRIDNMSANLKSGSLNSISDGDVLTIVGKMKKGAFMVCALRNETTGAYDASGVTLKVIMGVLMVMLGIPFSFFLIGLPLLFYGCLFLYNAYIGYQAKMLLDAAPRPTIAVA